MRGNQMFGRLYKNVFGIIAIFAAAFILTIAVLWLSGYYKPDFMTEGSKTVSTDIVTSDADYVIPGGQSIGVSIDVEDVIITGLEEIETPEGVTVNPGLRAGLQIGDIIIAIDGVDVKTASDVHDIIENTQQKTVTLKIGRRGELLHIDIDPVKSADDGVYRLGLWVKEKTAGILMIIVMTVLLYMSFSSFSNTAMKLSSTFRSEELNTIKDSRSTISDAVYMNRLTERIAVVCEIGIPSLTM